MTRILLSSVGLATYLIYSATIAGFVMFSAGCLTAWAWFRR